jgi:hypothetical protein
VPNIHISPEKFGLQVIGEVEWTGDFEFDKTIIWKELATGQLLIGQDQGNSIRVPFELHGVDGLFRVERSQQFIDVLLNISRPHASSQAHAQAAELVRKAKVEFNAWTARQQNNEKACERHQALARPKVTREEAAHVLGYMGQPGGYPPGDWTRSLISVMDRADRVNFARLSQALPGYGEALRMYKYDEDGHASLVQIAAGKVVPE